DALVDAFDEVRKPCALATTEKSVFVLHVEQLGRVDVDEGRNASVGRAILLRQPGDDVRGVCARFAAWLIDRDDVAAGTECPIEAVDDVFGERGDAALTRRKR